MHGIDGGGKLLTMHIFIHTINYMHFTCNAIKNEINVRDRQLPLLASRPMFSDTMLVREDLRQAYPERRFVGYNMLAGRWMVVVFCKPAPDHVHVISFRKANTREQKKLETQSL